MAESKKRKVGMARFKKGDRVRYYGPERKLYRRSGKVVGVDMVKGSPFVTVDLDDGEEWGAPEKDWSIAFNSSNPAVANAVEAARAVNADFYDVKRGLEKQLLEMERVHKEYWHLHSRAKKVMQAVELMVASGTTSDERRVLDGLRRQIFMVSPFKG